MKTTPLEYALMSDAAYHRAEDINPETGNNKFRDELESKGWETMHFVSHEDSESNYQGIVFVHKGNAEVVIAHRGTAISFAGQDVGGAVADLQAVVRNKIHPQVTECLDKTLTKEIKDYLLKEGYYLTFTGHSLGGFLATLSLYFCQRKDLGYSFPASRAVVFDPAGSQDIIEILEPHSNAGIGLGQEGISRLDIMHFLSYPNYVNSFRPHAGGTKYFISSSKVNDLLRESENHPIDYLVNSHILENLREAFDLATGYPKEGFCQIATDWPLINLDTLQSLKGNFGRAKFAIESLKSLGIVLKNFFTGGSSQEINPWQEILGGLEFQKAIAAGIQAIRNPQTESTLRNKLETRRIFSKEPYNKSLRLCHFTDDEVCFLESIDLMRENECANTQEAFFKEHGLERSDKILLLSFKLEKRVGCIILDHGSIFDFRDQLRCLAKRTDGLLLQATKFIKKRIDKIPNDVSELSTEVAMLKVKIDERLQNNSFYSRRWVGLLSTLAVEEGAEATGEVNITENQFDKILRAAKEEAKSSEGANVAYLSSVALGKNSKSKNIVNVDQHNQFFHTPRKSDSSVNDKTDQLKKK